MRFRVIVILLINAQFGNTSNILVWSPSYGRSHVMFMGNIADILTADGHNVTILEPMLDPQITTFGNKLPAHTIGIRDEFDAWSDLDMKGSAIWTAPTCTVMCVKWEDYKSMVEATYRICKGLVENEDLMRRLTESKFDLVYSEGLDTCGPGLFEVLKIKNAVILSTLGMMPRLYDIAGLLPSPSFEPIGLSPFSDELSFMDRLSNFNLYLFFELYKTWLDNRFWHMFNEKYPGLPSTRDILNEKTALIMTNVHEFAETTRPTTNMVRYIGGATIYDPRPLNKELNDLLDERPVTVLFCMGTVSQAMLMPEWMKMAFMETFNSFPNITFIWKYENPDDDLFKNVSNVYPMKWIPQKDLLADHRISLFITHGGMNSMLEAMHYGKPMIVVPVFADQLMNAQVVRRRGLGIVLDRLLLTKDILTEAIEKVLNDRSIAKHCSLVKSLLAGRPQQYRDDIVKYTRIIIEYGRLEHLQMFSRGMNIFQYLCLDVILFELCIVLIVVFLCIWLIKRVLFYIPLKKIKND